jgi:glycoside/pentoside/hexuronide:cation symporter, GPH family
MTKLSSRTKVLYGVADGGLALVTASIQFFLLAYFTDVLRYDPAIVGTALMVGKLTWDAVNDPLFGYFSDRTRSRWGRRRPYLLFGAIPLGLVTWLLFSLPPGLTGMAAFLIVLGSFLLQDTLQTLVAVPYGALTPELTPDYDERTSLSTVRMVFSVLGYILGGAMTTLIAGLFRSGLGWGEPAAYSGMGAVFGVIVGATVLATAFSVRERPAAEVQPSRLPPWPAFVACLRNGPFMQLMGAQFISSYSFTTLTSLLPFFLIYQLGMEAQVPIVMFVMLGTIGIFLYPAKWVAGRINKGPTYALGLFIASLAIIATFFFPQGATPLIYAVALVAGLGFSVQWVCPWSMIPDVIEYDELRTGERREGIYYGMWAFLTKFTSALGIATSGWALKLFGYVPNVAQTPNALLGIRLFFSLAPAVALLVSLPILIWYPITRRSHAELRARLAQGEGQSPPALKRPGYT